MSDTEFRHGKKRFYDNVKFPVSYTHLTLPTTKQV